MPLLSIIRSAIDGDSTPTVKDGITVIDVLKFSNTAEVTITAFDDGTAGQQLVCMFADDNTTIQSSPNLRLSSKGDFKSKNPSMLVLWSEDGNAWCEVSRCIYT